MVRLHLSLLPKSPITVSLGWVQEATTTRRVCDCGMAPLRTPKNYELLTVGKVKRGSSLSENLSITMGNWSDMIPYHCFMLQLIFSLLLLITLASRMAFQIWKQLWAT